MPDEIRFDRIETAIQAVKDGRIIIVADDKDRENEGDFLMAAEKVTPEAINLMVKYGRGLVCAPITRRRAYDLNLDYMVNSGATPTKQLSRFRSITKS